MKRKKLLMKKCIFGICLIIALVFVIGTIKCQDVIIAIRKYADNNIQVNNSIETAKEDGKENKNSTVQEQQCNTVRVVLMNSDYSSIYHSNVVVKANENIEIHYGKKLSQKKKADGNIKIDKDDKLFEQSDVVMIADKKNHIKIKSILRNDKSVPYTGKIYLYQTKRGIVAVNEVSLEDYVAAVVSSEISEKYPMEALKAQAVSARTFIVNKMLNDKKKKYKTFHADADDSTAYQVYNINRPKENAKKAAKETKGEVIKYDNKLIHAYYFSTSCGYTTNYSIWGKKKMPYLKEKHLAEKSEDGNISDKEFEKYIKNTKSQEEIESDCPFFRWHVKMSLSHVEYAVGSYLGYDIGKIEKIEVNKRGKGGIVSNITIYGSEKQVSIRNQNNIRKVLNPYNADIHLKDGSIRKNMSILPSAFFVIEPVMKGKKLWGFELHGGGFGHGSGLSQNGMRILAEKGMQYKDIINYFYEKTAIVQISE